MILTDVAIIGGGLSGLYLASQLEAAGVDYRLIEARSRFGGRILCADANHPAEHLRGYDLGPSWFWQGQPRIASLIKSAGLTSYAQYSQGDLVFEEAGQIRHLNFSTMEGALRVEQGMGGLISFLLSKLNADKLMPGEAVGNIRQLANSDSGFNWQLTLNNSESEQTQLAAKAVVLAVPPRVVDEVIHFEPALPVYVRQSLQSIPTWMGRFTKVIAEYETPFWRDMQLSGDAISRTGPLQEIHDATLAGSTTGALFGFMQQLPRNTDPQILRQQVTEQLTRLFGPMAAKPVNVWLQNWSAEKYSATSEDWRENLTGHPQYSMPANLEGLSEQGLLFISTEMSHYAGGLIEGALEAADTGLSRLKILGLV
ncbi:flavin monoamine oxidase family protein [Aliamphritea ceti]|uniref:flavin monoamine oxidase family protein n=1 Tax=Aliamphritea ceti TaxID=1524258 RepID=UPI0021C4967F|nr:FAD-dependent oxidoreductase [Aliamphritea ceti]